MDLEYLQEFKLYLKEIITSLKSIDLKRPIRDKNGNIILGCFGNPITEQPSQINIPKHNSFEVFSYGFLENDTPYWCYGLKVNYQECYKKDFNILNKIIKFIVSKDKYNSYNYYLTDTYIIAENRYSKLDHLNEFITNLKKMYNQVIQYV